METQAKPLSDISKLKCPACQASLINTHASDIGTRLGCPTCHSISLKPGDLSKFSLTKFDIPGLNWIKAKQSTLNCCYCPGTLLWKVTYSEAVPEEIRLCQSCDHLWLSHDGLGKIRRSHLKLTNPNASQELFDPQVGNVGFYVFAAAILFAMTADYLSFLSPVLTFFDSQIHNLGHAMVSCFTGVLLLPKRLPAPAQLPKGLVVAVVTASLVTWRFIGSQQGLKIFTWFFTALVPLPAILTFLVPEVTGQSWVVLGGLLGPLVIPSLFAVAYFTELPKFWSWNYFRFVAIFIALYCLEHNANYWGQIAQGKVVLPSLQTDPSHLKEDVMRLITDYQWGEKTLLYLVRGLSHCCHLLTYGTLAYFANVKFKLIGSVK